jgi:putative permease
VSTTSRRTSEDAGRQPTRLTWTSAVLLVSVVLGFVVVRGAFIASQRVLGWTAAAIAVAVFIEPIVASLGRFIPRVLAVILTFALFAGVAGVLVFGTVADLDREVARLQDVAPEAIAGFEERDDELGRLAREIRLSERSQTFLDALDERVGSGTGALAENAPSAPAYLVSAILAIFLLVYGPAIARGAARQIDDETRRHLVFRVLERSTVLARRTVTALLTQALVVGGATMLAARLLDLPAPMVLGLIAGVTAMLPDVGIVLGLLPTVSLAAAFRGVLAAALVLAASIAVQLFEALHLRRRIREFGVDVGPAVIWIVALVGFSLYGPGMAFYGVVYAIFVVAVIDQVPAARIAMEADVALPVPSLDDAADVVAAGGERPPE